MEDTGNSSYPMLQWESCMLPRTVTSKYFLKRYGVSLPSSSGCSKVSDTIQTQRACTQRLIGHYCLLGRDHEALAEPVRTWRPRSLTQ